VPVDPRFCDFAVSTATMDIAPKYSARGTERVRSISLQRGVICEPDFLSGASALRRTIEALEPGDVLMVTRLDRLARSTRDLLNTLAAITQERQASAR
jgi:DNA invertase Pin-like site-specific DNA recombinase